MLNIIQKTTKKNCYVGENNPEYVVIHETDNWNAGASAAAHASAMQNGNLSGTVHYYVDSGSIYQTLEHSDGAWAVGDGKGKYGITNRNSINIEICVNPESDYYKAVDNAEQLAAYLLNMYGWDTDRLKRHYDASRKHCPRRILDEGLWDSFVSKTAQYMGGNPGSNTSGGSYQTGLYRVDVAELNIRKGPGTNYDAVGSIKDNGTYTITEIQNGSWGRLKSGVGWINVSTSYCSYVGEVSGEASSGAGEFLVRVSTSNLRIRKGPGTSYGVAGICPKGIYTITETKEAEGYTWGHLKSGAGWIALKYTERV